VQQDLADLAGFEAVAKRGADMHRDLVLSPEGGQHRQRDSAASATVQAFAAHTEPQA